MRYEHILVTTHAGLGTITMNRPERRNALSEAHMRELIDAFHGLGDDADVARRHPRRQRARSFCAGHDFADMVERDLDGMRRLLGVCTDADADHAARTAAGRRARARRSPPPPGCQLVASRRPRGRRRGSGASRRPAAAAAGSATRRWWPIARSVGPQARARDGVHGRPDRRADRARVGPREPRRAPRARLDEETERLARARQPRQPRLEGARQARLLRHHRPRRRRRLRARRRGHGDERPRPTTAARRCGRSSRSGPASIRRAGSSRIRTDVASARRFAICRDAMTAPVAYFCMEFGLSRGVPDLRRRPRHPGRRLHQVGARPGPAGDRRRAALGARLLAPAHRRGRPARRGVPDLPRRLPRGHRRPGARAGRDARGRGARLAHRALGQRAALPARAGRDPRRLDHARLYDPDVRLPRGAGDPARRRRRARAAQARHRRRRLPLQRGPRGRSPASS